MDALPLSPMNTLLFKLEGVKRYGKGHRARCPACGGKSAKLAITEADNGAVLLHCFGGCKPAEVLAAVDLRLADLFLERLRPMTEAERRDALDRGRMSRWQAALEVVCKEIAIVQLAQRQLARGRQLSKDDAARLQRAEDLIANAYNVLCPPPARFRPEVCRG